MSMRCSGARIDTGCRAPGRGSRRAARSLKSAGARTFSSTRVRDGRRGKAFSIWKALSGECLRGGQFDPPENLIQHQCAARRRGSDVARCKPACPPREADRKKKSALYPPQDRPPSIRVVAFRTKNRPSVSPPAAEFFARRVTTRQGANSRDASGRKLASRPKVMRRGKLASPGSKSRSGLAPRPDADRRGANVAKFMITLYEISAHTFTVDALTKEGAVELARAKFDAQLHAAREGSVLLSLGSP